jgi:hypothetical protein
MVPVASRLVLLDRLSATLRRKTLLPQSWSAALHDHPRVFDGIAIAHARCPAVRTARSWRGILSFTHLAREGRMTVTIGRRQLLAALGGAASLFFCVNAAAQEGYYGADHDKWHQGFYSKLKRNDGQGSCCNLMDCRPTQSRIVGDHYEVKVDGVWMPVPYEKINNVVAPDGGAHVCAPRQVGPNKGIIFCVILPSEG